LNPAWVYYSHIAGLKNAIRPTTINIQGRNQTAPRRFPTQAFRRFTSTSALSAESATEADSALQGSTMQEWQSPQRKQIPPNKSGCVGRNETAPKYFPTQAFRRLTPTSALTAESATEADSALQARMVEHANPCSCAARAEKRIPLLLIINLFDGTKSKQKEFKGAVIRQFDTIASEDLWLTITWNTPSWMVRLFIIKGERQVFCCCMVSLPQPLKCDLWANVYMLPATP